jgi:hypothetical protein
MSKFMFGIVVVVAALSFVAVKSIISSSGSTAASLQQEPHRPLDLMIRTPHHLPIVQADLS